MLKAIQNSKLKIESLSKSPFPRVVFSLVSVKLPMRSLYFLVPGTTRKFACGGLFAELKTLALAKQICEAAVVTYRQREDGVLFLDNLLQSGKLEQSIFVISWGFDVPKLAQRLRQQHVVYHAHSANYGFSLPASIPIMTVSRNTMGYWGQRSPNSLIYYLPNQISPEFCNWGLTRDLDVLVQTRKTSSYVKHQLIPALQKQCSVQIVDTFVEDIAGLFNRAKVYLYDSAEYWAIQGVTEGFGLPPMEAIACGCYVFSSVNSALADYLDPEFNCHKIAGYSTNYDVQRILKVLKQPNFITFPESFFSEYRSENIVKRLTLILNSINEFFDYQQQQTSDIPNLDRWRVSRLKAQQFLRKVKQKL